VIATYARGLVALALAGVGGVTVLAIRPLVSCGVASELRARALARALAQLWARAILAVLGVRLCVRGRLPRRPVVYVANHSSALDVLLVLALGLPRTRSFLSEWAGRVWPLRHLGDCLGVFWTVPQGQQAERRRRFASAARALRETGESVFLSPEGVRVRGRGVGPFNRGAFHLALDLGRDLIPLHVRIPECSDPDAGGWIAPGCVSVEVLPRVSTEGWNLERLQEHVAEVRGLFLRVAATEPLALVESRPCFAPSRSQRASCPSRRNPQGPPGRPKPGIAPRPARATLWPSLTTPTRSSISQSLRA